MPEDYQPGFYELDPRKVNVTVSLEEAIEKVKAMWPVPSTEETSFRLMRDDDEGWTRWELDWDINGSSGLTALVDAYTGKIRVIIDYRRRSGNVDNLNNTDKAIELAEEVLRKFEISTEDLSTPAVIKDDMPTAIAWNITYTVRWGHLYKGLKVEDSAIAVEIDAETLKTVSFSNGLLDIPDLDIVPGISKDQAIETVENFLSSEVISSKGYGECKALKKELVIARPNYDPKQDKLLPMGEPILVWYIYTGDTNGRSLKIMIDAQTGSVVGYRPER